MKTHPFSPIGDSHLCAYVEGIHDDSVCASEADNPIHDMRLHPSERAAARLRKGMTHEDYKRIIDEEYAREEPHRVPCCNCGAPTTIDATYGDLCYRCIRADNE